MAWSYGSRRTFNDTRKVAPSYLHPNCDTRRRPAQAPVPGLPSSLLGNTDLELGADFQDSVAPAESC